MEGTPRPETVSTKLHRIAQQAVEYPECVFTTLAHLIDVEFLAEAFHKTHKDAAPGVDGVTASQYAIDLDEKLHNLHKRLRNGNYKAMPVKRVWLDKEDGNKRPIGIAELEDKIAQRAVAMLLDAIYEQDFYDFSYGFRQGRSAHQALSQLRECCMEMNVNWIIDADICGFFDNLDRNQLREIIKLRVNDGAILRLIGKWLNAGVMDGNDLYFPGKGTVQGGVISPILGNIYLHTVLDRWFIEKIEPQLTGRSLLIRFADDFLLGFEHETEAKWVMQELIKRLAQFGLTIHPEKSKLIKFRKQHPREAHDEEIGTIDFLGFTHYWAKSRKGYWVIKRRTAKKRLHRTIKRIWHWCQINRHEPIKLQHQKLSAKLRGHYQYFGIRCNLRALKQVHIVVKKTWRFWLNKRGGKYYNWEKFEDILKVFPLPIPRIIHSI